MRGCVEILPAFLPKNPVTSMNRTLAQFFKAACLTVCVAAAPMPSLQAGWAQLGGEFALSFVGQERPANSYRTDLWKMEFQETDEEEANPDPQDETQGPSAGIRRASENGSEEWGKIPGHVYLSDVAHDTPFAEWQVDKSAAGKFQQFSTGPTAWVMSHVRARGSGLHVEAPKANGPSMLTLLVAIIACMVMIGALFAER